MVSSTNTLRNSGAFSPLVGLETPPPHPRHTQEVPVNRELLPASEPDAGPRFVFFYEGRPQPQQALNQGLESPAHPLRTRLEELCFFFLETWP